MRILLANPRGFCAGVDRAIDIVDRALVKFGSPIYVRNEVVHNRYVVNDMRERGVIFVRELSEVPDESTVIFSAHGVAKSVFEDAKKRKLHVLDATCPLVSKVHLEAAQHARLERECILIGHAGHPEVEGTMGQVNQEKQIMYLVEVPEDVENLQIRDPQNVAYITQTTLSVDDANNVIQALRKRFPAIVGPRRDDICYATQNRQDALRKLANQCDVVIVVGSANSSNSNRLAELSSNLGTLTHLVDSPDMLEQSWFENCQVVGVTAGASAPDVLVSQILDQLKIWGADEISEVQGIEENVQFPLPAELQNMTNQSV